MWVSTPAVIVTCVQCWPQGVIMLQDTNNNILEIECGNPVVVDISPYLDFNLRVDYLYAFSCYVTL